MASSKFSYEPLVVFWNTRSTREKNMILVLLFLAILFVDYSLFIRPVQGFYATTMPKLAEVKRELKTLKEDRKNKEAIQSGWEKAKASLAEQEKKFIDWDEISFLIQRLSEMAASSGIKVVGIQPSDIQHSAGAKGGYVAISVELSAFSGTHELGRFLEKIETGGLFLKVVQIEIRENPADYRRHSVRLKIQSFRKSAA